MTTVFDAVLERAHKPFINEPLTDFTSEQSQQAQHEAIEQVRGELGQTYPLIIGDQKIFGEKTFASLNPTQPDEVVGYFTAATVEQTEQAIRVAAETFEDWKRVPAHERASYLFTAADLMRRRKFTINAWMMFETGKSWVEADADTAEAIDFLEYYAREALRLAEEQPIVQVPGEHNQLVYIPLGVTAVIPPWNFPCAIMTGMTSASFVAGNTAILKPASTAPAIAYQFMKILEDVGLPYGVVSFLTGSGAIIGDTLIDSPRVRLIAFTGSREVGTRIYERASKTPKGQLWLKRSILEMGGKDAVVVDETADLEAAASAIVASAFGYQGQKCSAGSRAIIVQDVYDEMLQKVVEKTKRLTIGDITRPENTIGPVIDENAMHKILEYIEIGRAEGHVLLGGTHEGPGYFITPTVIADVDPQARIAQEEIFGPVLAVIKAQDFEDALAIANGTEYGLTGAFFSKDEQRIKQVEEEYHVGNLYINRKCTGALVGVQPFGGFNMSGTDSKAGGRDYLLLFTQAKSIAVRQ